MDDPSVRINYFYLSIFYQSNQKLLDKSTICVCVCVKKFFIVDNFFPKIIMVSINFCPPAYHLLTSGSILKFQQSMFSFPSDRHAYHLKFFMHPMRYCLLLLLHFYKIIVSRLIYFMFSQGRLPYQVKIFVKYINLDPPPPLFTKYM